MEKRRGDRKTNNCPRIKITDIEGQEREFILKDSMILGRPTMEAVPDIPLFSQIVSRKHGEFRLENGQCFYEDLGSHNGTWLNGKLIKEKTLLKSGDVLVIKSGRVNLDMGEFKLCFIEGTADTPDDLLQIHIEKRVAQNGFRKKNLLKDIHMNVSSGEMVLILGGSGAGKTTFINAVMGYEEAEGEIIFDGRNVYEEYEDLKYEIAYVPQQDLIRGTDTVWGTLCNAAQMRMPADTEMYKKFHQAELVLEMFGLEREKEELVSKLSGGQRKRLSIATEYIGNPSLFFLDEPDSGLDGIMARSLMEKLREIADQNKIVMIISHSPDRAADLFDKVIVLAKSQEDDCGHLAFYGSVKDAEDFFETSTLEGIVKRINRLDEGGEGKADYYITKYAQKNG